MSKKYDRGLIDEINAQKKELNEIEAKRLYDIVCNHIAYPLLFNLNPLTEISRIHINKTPPKNMTGYVYICGDCVPYLQNINQETSKRCFSRMHESEFMKNIKYNKAV